MGMKRVSVCVTVEYVRVVHEPTHCSGHRCTFDETQVVVRITREA